MICTTVLADWAHASGGNGGTMTATDDARRAIAAIDVWRHRIAVAPGVVTPGTEDTATELGRLGLPSTLHGERVLDVGCSDGFYAFECERRGADVVAVDDESSLLSGGRNGFQIAHDLLGSRAEYRVADVQGLAEDETGTYDRVLFVNVLYHVPNPMLGMQELARVTKPGGSMHLKTYFRADVRFRVRGRCVNVDLDRRPKFWFFPTTELAGDPTNWWAPNRRGLLALFEATGWERPEHLGTYDDRIYYRVTRAR